jgi:aspartate aminotransferase
MSIAMGIAADMQASSWIRRMFEEGARLAKEIGPDKVFDFSIGNPPEEPPEPVLRALREELEKPPLGMHRYMPNGGFPEVRARIAEFVAKDSGRPIVANNVVMTTGAAGAMNVALKALLDPDDEVVVISPFFPEYLFYVSNHCGKVAIARTKDDFHLDLESLRRAVTGRTKVIIINSPNNPTGVVYSSEEIARLGDLVQELSTKFDRDIYVLSDEPYRKLLYEGIKLPHVFQYVENALIAMSHSKDLALAGERIGYLVVNSGCGDLERLQSAMVFINRTLGYVNAPALMQLVVGGLQDVSIGRDKVPDATRPDLFLVDRDGVYDGQTARRFLLFPEIAHSK